MQKSGAKLRPETGFFAGLENTLFRPYSQIMDTQPDNTPAGWLEALERADAEIDSGLFVTSEEVHRQLLEGTESLRAKAEARKREASAEH